MGRNAVDPLPGTIFLTQIEGWVGTLVWLLQAANGDLSRWSHVGIVLENGDTFEAQPGGAVIGKLSDYADRPIAFIPWEMDDLTRWDIVEQARGLEGTPYAWGTYLYLAAVRLHLPFAAKALKRRVERLQKFICSQAADLLYVMHGQHLFDDGRKPYDLTPGDFAPLLKGTQHGQADRV